MLRRLGLGMLLARRGYRVLVVDQALSPSDTVSSHWLHEPGVAKLSDWGLLDTVRATGCPPIRTVSIDRGFLVLRGSRRLSATSTSRLLRGAPCSTRSSLTRLRR
jgi:2-polyprenyl-6-methoxyphenol hydroxylase-like FAD-dependent oxidoreductase